MFNDRIFRFTPILLAKVRPEVCTFRAKRLGDDFGFVFPLVFVDFFGQQAGLGLERVLGLGAVPNEQLEAGVK